MKRIKIQELEEKRKNLAAKVAFNKRLGKEDLSLEEDLVKVEKKIIDIQRLSNGD